jgi:hypothetical protein
MVENTNGRDLMMEMMVTATVTVEIVAAGVGVMGVMSVVGVVGVAVGMASAVAVALNAGSAIGSNQTMLLYRVQKGT